MAGDLVGAYVLDVDDERSTATDRPGRRVGVKRHLRKYEVIKANVVRITVALVILASLALTLGAGIRWD